MTNNANAVANVHKCNTLRGLRNIINNATADLAAGKDFAHARLVHDAAIGRFVEISATSEEARSEVDQALFTALYAYEFLRSQEKGRTTRSTYLRRKIKDTDIVTAVSGSVLKGRKTSGLRSLLDMDRLDMSFEAVIIKYETEFDPAVVTAARKTLAEFE